MDGIGIYRVGVHTVVVDLGRARLEMFDGRNLSPAKARQVAVALAGWLGVTRDDPARVLEPRFARRARRELVKLCGTLGLSSAAVATAKVQVHAPAVEGDAAPNGYAPLLSVAVGSVVPREVVEYRRAHPRYGQHDPARGPYFARLSNGRRVPKGPAEPTDLEPPAIRYEAADQRDWDAVERAGGGDCELI